MPDDKQNKPQNKSWIDRLSDAMVREPQTQEQLLEVLDEAHKRELLDRDALSMITNILEFSESQVRSVMIAKPNMVVIEQDSRIDEIISTVTASGHSRFPVTGQNQDEIIGILLAKDLLHLKIENHTEKTLSEILRPAVFIPESKRLDKLLTEFRNNRNHMAVVLDEYGNVAGLVTIEDVLEEIVGEIADEFDSKDEKKFIKPIEHHQFLVSALTPVDEFNEVFGTEFSEEDFDTMGGIITQKMAHLPEPGENIDIDGIRFSIVDMDKRRIREMKVQRLESDISPETKAKK